MAVIRGTTSNKKVRKVKKEATPKQINAVVRASRSKHTNPEPAARSRKVARSPQGATAFVFADARRQEAKAKIRKVTRRAVRKDMPAGETKGGLGITKDEGSRGLQRAVKTLGYKGSRRLVKKVAAKRKK